MIFGKANNYCIGWSLFVKYLFFKHRFKFKYPWLMLMIIRSRSIIASTVFQAVCTIEQIDPKLTFALDRGRRV